MGGVGGTEGVSLPDESSGLIRQVWDEVRDMTLGDVMKGGLQEDAPEDSLAYLARGRRGKAGKIGLGLLEEATPSGPPEVDEGMLGRLGKG